MTVGSQPRDTKRSVTNVVDVIHKQLAHVLNRCCCVDGACQPKFGISVGVCAKMVEVRMAEQYYVDS
jgi:hypothetical protein